MRYKWSQEDLIHNFLPKEPVCWTYVIENEVDGKMQITDFFSIHRMLQWCTSEGCKHEKMYSGFLYYYYNSVNDLQHLMLTAMHTAKDDLECDAFTVQIQGGNDPQFFRDKLGMMRGDGILNIYLVNWSCGDDRITNQDISAMLV